MSAPARDWEALALPYDRPSAPARQRAAVPFALDDVATGRLLDVTGGGRFLIATSLVGAVATVLARGRGRRRVGIGTPARLRSGHVATAVPAGDELVPVVFTFDPAHTFRDLLGTVRATLLAAYHDADGSGRDPRRDAAAHLQAAVRVAGIHARLPVRFGGIAIDVDVDVEAPRLTGVVHFDAGRHLDGFVAGLAGRVARALAEGLGDVDRPAGSIDLFAAGERGALAAAAPRPERPQPRPPAAEEPTIHGIVESVARQTPDAVAVVDGDRRLTYAQLDRRANAVAHRLRAAGVGHEDRVGVVMDRSLELLVAILGTLKAGGAWVPVDPVQPDRRVQLVMDGTGAAVVLRAVDVHGAGEQQHPPAGPAVSPGQLAYVVATSGSTGRPKGVMATHAALCALTRETIAHLGVGSHTRVLQFASPGFDASIWQAFTALHAGAELHLVPPDAAYSPDAVARIVRDASVELADLPPSLLALLDPGAVPSLATVTTGGERTPAAAVQRWRTRRFFNVYGPTEATVAATWHRVGDGDDPLAVPIGKPIPGTTARVLDERMEPMPPGLVGELYLGGDGVARGYHGEPALTAEAFVPDPFGPPGARLYRTGDLARMRRDGVLEFHGRADEQVKLRGFRIEPGEVESVLVQHDAVREAAVALREEVGGGARLVAYVAGDAAGLDVAAVRAHARAHLPEYMVPTAFVVVDRIPRLANEKVDRAALARLAATDDGSHVELDHAGPSPSASPEVERVAAIMAAVLGRDHVGPDDDFFALGGHSLLAGRVVARVAIDLGVDVPLRVLFDAPTPAGLAAHVAGIVA